MEVLLLAIALIGLGFLGMAFNIVFRKKRFPETHVGHNKEMRKIGVVCAKTMDRMERKKVKDELKFKKIKVVR